LGADGFVSLLHGFLSFLFFLFYPRECAWYGENTGLSKNKKKQEIQENARGVGKIQG
jgi:hypothetical protein